MSHMTQTANLVTLLASPLGEEGHEVAKGVQANWIHRGAPRPANPVTCFPPGKVVALATKGGMHFLERSEVGLFSDARQGGIKIGAESAAPRQRSDTI